MVAEEGPARFSEEWFLARKQRSWQRWGKDEARKYREQLKKNPKDRLALEEDRFARRYFGDIYDAEFREEGEAQNPSVVHRQGVKEEEKKEKKEEDPYTTSSYDPNVDISHRAPPRAGSPVVSWDPTNPILQPHENPSSSSSYLPRSSSSYSYHHHHPQQQQHHLSSWYATHSTGSPALAGLALAALLALIVVSWRRGGVAQQSQGVTAKVLRLGRWLLWLAAAVLVPWAARWFFFLAWRLFVALCRAYYDYLVLPVVRALRRAFGPMVYWVYVAVVAAWVAYAAWTMGRWCVSFCCFLFSSSSSSSSSSMMMKIKEWLLLGGDVDGGDGFFDEENNIVVRTVREANLNENLFAFFYGSNQEKRFVDWFVDRGYVMRPCQYPDCIVPAEEMW